MWRRTYLLLLAVRFYFAISPSYIHPDENFQGPEVIAGVFLNNPPHSVIPPSLRVGEIDLGIIIMHKPQPGARAGRCGDSPKPQKRNPTISSVTPKVKKANVLLINNVQAIFFRFHTI